MSSPARPLVSVAVPVDVAAADRAARALRTAAATIDATTDARVRAASEAQRDWRGPSRSIFDDELRRLVRTAADLAAACRSAAAAVEATAEAARVDQRRQPSR